MIAVAEVWKVIDGFEHYEVSNLGRVRSWRHRYKGRRQSPKVLKQFKVGKYLAVILCRGVREHAKRYVHQLVLETFVGPRPEGMEVRHGPGGRYDNSLGNLCWGTHAENMADLPRDGIQPSRWLQALSDEQAAEAKRRIRQGEMSKVIANDLGVSPMTICRLRRGETYKDVS